MQILGILSSVTQLIKAWNNHLVCCSFPHREILCRGLPPRDRLTLVSRLCPLLIALSRVTPDVGGDVSKQEDGLVSMCQIKKPVASVAVCREIRKMNWWDLKEDSNFSLILCVCMCVKLQCVDQEGPPTGCKLMWWYGDYSASAACRGFVILCLKHTVATFVSKEKEFLKDVG